MEASRLAPPLVHRYRCLPVRHRAAACQACAAACPRRAIALAPGPEVDAGRCSGCGVCTAVCPTGALEPAGPTLDDVLAECGAGVLACRRAAGGRSPLPCLGFLDVGMLLAAAALAGLAGLDAGPCAACPEAAGLAAAERALAEANAVLRALGWQEPLAFVHEKDYAGEPGVSRRELLGLLRRQPERRAPTREAEPVGPVARGRASRAWLKPRRRELLLTAVATLSVLPAAPPLPLGEGWGEGRPTAAPEEHGQGEGTRPLPRPRFAPLSAGTSLRSGQALPDTGRGDGPAGTEPRPYVPPSRAGKACAERSEAGYRGLGSTPADPPLSAEQRRSLRPEMADSLPLGLPFWEVALGEACDGCGRCLTFCPTGALRSERHGAKAAMVFMTEGCLGCGLCAQVCPRGAILLSRAPRLPARGATRTLRAVPVARCPRCGAAYPVFLNEAVCPDCRQKQRLDDAIRRLLFAGEPPADGAQDEDRGLNR